MLFHLVIGAMYLAKEEMTYEGKKCFCGQKAAETVWVRSVCSKNPDDTELPALRSSNQIGILETIELHPRIIFTYSRIWFSVSNPRFHVRAWN